MPTNQRHPADFPSISKSVPEGSDGIPKNRDRQREKKTEREGEIRGPKAKSFILSLSLSFSSLLFARPLSLSHQLAPSLPSSSFSRAQFPPTGSTHSPLFLLFHFQHSLPPPLRSPLPLLRLYQSLGRDEEKGAARGIRGLAAGQDEKRGGKKREFFPFPFPPSPITHHHHKTTRTDGEM